MTSDRLIDEFAARLRANGISLQLRDNTAQIAEFERELGRRLPASYRSLVTRYEFAAFDIGGITMSGTEPSDEFEAVPRASFRDRALYEVIGPAGFIPIGRPDTGSYDPVCFDGRRSARNHEYPIVCLDHEAALINYKAEITGSIAKSFAELII